MQLKQIIPAIIFPALFFVSCAQQQKLSGHPVTIHNGERLYAVLQDSLYAHQDSLALWNRDGVVFFRMSYSNLHFKDVRSSENAPPALIRLVSRVITNQEIKVNGRAAKKFYFILPVRYYFAGGKTGSVIPLMEAVPEIDISKLPGKPVNWFNQFFEIDPAEGQLQGLPCVFLPWLSVRGQTQ